MPVNKKAATGVAIAAGVLAVGAGLGVASLAQAEPTPSPGAPSSSPSTGTQPGERGPGGRGGMHRGGAMFGADAKQLAEKLGVTEAKVTEALRAIHEERKADRPDPSASPSAKPTGRIRPSATRNWPRRWPSKLGVDEAKVKTALDEIRAARQAERAAELKTRLDAAVKDGTLTQAEADAVTKAVEKGVIGGGPR